MFLSVLTSKLGLAGIALVLLLSVFGIQAARLAHAKHELASMKSAQKLAKADIAAHEAKASKISSEASGDLQKMQTTTAAKFKRLIARVPEVDTDQVDRACQVPRGWVDLWNAGATPPTPPSPGPE